MGIFKIKKPKLGKFWDVKSTSGDFSLNPTIELGKIAGYLGGTSKNSGPLGQVDTAKADELSSKKKEMTDVIGNTAIDSLTRDELYKQIQNASDIKQFDSISDIFADAQSGEKPKYKSRIRTEKLFKTMVDQPGRKQTVFAPMNNQSRSVLGV